ncbi:Uncharacterized protein Fot_21395 [Forsythia ovata]|uniref:Uncharacterized protein n=1 Tax=Forsythia ovata TaxID=205694 RepID=A0ABD1UUQ6_9LAMI
MAEDASGQHHVVATTTTATPTSSPLLHFLPHTSTEDDSGHHHPHCANTTLSPPPLRLLQLVHPFSTSSRTHRPKMLLATTSVVPTPRRCHHHCYYSNWFSPHPLPPAHIYQLCSPPLPDLNQCQTIPYNLRDHNPTPRRRYFPISVINTKVIPELDNGGTSEGGSFEVIFAHLLSEIKISFEKFSPVVFKFCAMTDWKRRREETAKSAPAIVGRECWVGSAVGDRGGGCLAVVHRCLAG